MTYLFTAIGFPPGGNPIAVNKNRKETAVYKRRKNTQSNTKTMNRQAIKQRYETIK
jgi:hypothetical protein